MAVLGLAASPAAQGQTISANEAKGIGISGQWRGSRGLVTKGPDGKVIFLYGEIQP
ncbi:P-type conjugative transfer protein TrbG, partial [Mesorhizobium sp. M5C.F.Ca.IN.020.29.1.1]